MDFNLRRTAFTLEKKPWDKLDTLSAGRVTSTSRNGCKRKMLIININHCTEILLTVKNISVCIKVYFAVKKLKMEIWTGANLYTDI